MVAPSPPRSQGDNRQNLPSETQAYTTQNLLDNVCKKGGGENPMVPPPPPPPTPRRLRRLVAGVAALFSPSFLFVPVHSLSPRRTAWPRRRSAFLPSRRTCQHISTAAGNSKSEAVIGSVRKKPESRRKKLLFRG